MEQSRELRQLFEACSQGRVEVVTSLLDSGFDVNARDEDDTTALQLAAASGQEQVVRLLLIRGSAVDQANSTGWTPLLHAARNGHTAVAALLIQHHASVHAKTCYGAEVACLAARSGSMAMCRLLAGAGVSFDAVLGGTNNVGSVLEITPMVVAAHMGHDSVLKHLLSSADVNHQVKPTGVTALMAAAVGGHVSTTRLLVERGKTNVNAADVNSKCALDYSIMQDKRQVKEYLESKTIRCRHPSLRHTSPSIIDAVKNANIEQVREILEGDVFQRDACMPHDGATPLMFSAMLGHSDIVKLLIEKGCNVNAQDTISGWTALMQAVFRGQKDIAVCLIHAGADVTIQAKSGCTAFDMASIIADIDTELYRLLAARAMPVVAPNEMQTFFQSNSSSMDTVNHLQKTGVKAWWSRISKRFSNLKQPENISSDNHELTEVMNDVTLRNPTDTRVTANDALLKSLTVNPLAAVVSVRNEHDQNLTGRTVKSDSMFSLDLSGVMSTRSSTATLTSVITPVFPSPIFHTDRTSKMPPASLRKPRSNQTHSPSSLLTRSVSSGVKLLQNQHSTLNLVNRIANPPPRVQFAKRPAVKITPQTDISPSASYNASTLGGSGNSDFLAMPKSVGVLSSASSSTLTAGSDNNGNKSPSVELLQSNRKNIRDHVEAKPADHPIRPNLHHFDAANLTPTAPNLSSAGKHSGISTSIMHHGMAINQYQSVTECDQTDLGGILRKLSLECYQPIFDDQEVDLEAFLTLTDCDLKELGIQSPESRRQILSTISEMNANKDQEQQLRQKTMVNYSTGQQERAHVSKT